ncbi:hypothetical protein D7147_25800 [Micromonospora musae]|uniref:Helix-hairpin-helix domain-containing protein n=1 Tax=Micromonospora musae TaxID=1894970 RepID=A0A3A9Y1U4_9ACTN|nr:hypothetical protein [Micromonospora musae]RKN15268.1 hypothetical protein D7147_25800 [Micromonospora musae]RKN30633.1 hypothetical protein D7044_19790 [Micromonospora musae]
MAWSFGQSLTVILALLIGLAGGWFLRGRRDARKPDPATVDAAPAATTAVLAPPAPAAVTDAEQPVATIDPAPTAVADETTVPAERGDAGAALPEEVATTGVPPVSDVDPADMALTDGPAPVVAPRSAPEAERLDATGSAGADEPATIASEPEPVASLPEPQPVASLPEPEPATGELVAAEPTEAVVAEPADAATPGAEPAVTASSAALPFGALVPPNQPERAAPAPVATTAEESTAVDDERAEPPTRPSPVATPPVRPVAATSVEVDDFRRIQGVGPKMAAALQAAGVRTYRQLADLDEPALRELIRGAGLRAAPGLATWPQQARLLATAPDEATTAPTGASEA